MNSKAMGIARHYRAATDLLIMNHVSTTATVSRAFFIVLFDETVVQADDKERRTACD
jgi:hypothetical protein